jgi:hypothetical protein
MAEKEKKTDLEVASSLDTGVSVILLETDFPAYLVLLYT